MITGFEASQKLYFTVGTAQVLLGCFDDVLMVSSCNLS
jgi:hypothetical protein